MQTCILMLIESDKYTENAVTLEQRLDSSPLRRALKAHFESYSGLVEPRREIADVALRTQRDDL
jgi:hypothetical protein